jgi:hypothetical protein
MLHRFKLLVLALLAATSFQALAHEGHDHDEESLTEKQVAQIAAKTLPALVQAKKVGAGWATAQREDVTIRPVAGKDIWVVTYKNPDGKLDGGQSLSLIFDDLGNFVEANHTGKLKNE